MASTTSENGDSQANQEDVSKACDLGEIKMNGEVNGSYEEPMEVDDSPVKAIKKITSSDINCITETADNDDSVSEIKEQRCLNSDLEVNDKLENKVPETEEASSNGYSDQHDNEDEAEDSLENKKENNVNNETETTENGDDDVVLMSEDEAKDPFATDTNPLEETDTAPEGESTADADTSDVEPIEDEDPLLSEQANDESNNDDKPETEVDNAERKEEAHEDVVMKEVESIDSNDKNNTKEDCEMDSSETTEKDKNTIESSEKVVSSPASAEKDNSTTENSEKDISSVSNSEKDSDKGEGEKVEEDGDEKSDKLTPEEEVEKTPEKSKKKKSQQQQPINVTPRRSSRNVNKPKTYIDEPDIKGITSPPKKTADDDDIEEIVPQDPLAMDSPVSDKKNKKTVVVNDPKRLVEIASGNKEARPGKKEPTLVIIDTNSILSGKGPVPVTPSSSAAGPSHGPPGYSVLPVALPAQGMYPQPLRHTTVKPILPTPSPPPQASPKPPVILPSLTDDMYVVEAPSFIVPYVYEKPPIKPLKGFVDQVEQAIKEIKAQLEKEKEKEKADEAKEEEKEKSEGKDSEEKKDKPEEVKEEKDKDETKDEKMEVDSESEKPKDEQKAKEETKDAEKSSETKSADSKTDADKSTEDAKQEEGEKKKSSSYFDNPLGKFFIQIGVNLVQEHVQTDLLRSQKRKKEREGAKCTPEVQQAMNSLIRSLEYSKETNEPFKLELKKCEFCSFKTESALVMAHHLETPHMRNYVYRCNFCPLEVRSPHDILYHMEAEHNVRGRLERAPAFHQCPSCPFEDNQKGKLSRHLLSCAKKYRPERNQEPPLDFEPPAKIPRVSRNRPSMSPGTAVYQAAMSGLKPNTTPTHPLLPKLVPAPSPPGLIRGRGRPQMINRYLGDMRSPQLAAQQKAMAAQMRPGMLYRPSGTNAQPQVLLPTSYQLAGSQLYQAAVANKATAGGAVPTVGATTAKLLQQPSISITPLPRQAPPPAPVQPAPPANKPGRPAGSSKATFVICEICDGYIKDLEQLRNHMQWIHKVKIHPKMIYNRPPLNCQKCQFRFFTDQGLERHLLGSHGLVTSSMQEAANKGKDGGRCPVCGRVYQWKLLNHVARDHNMSLKPAHLSYKCTVCTATFGMYKQFENHVYSAHSVVAKRVMDKKPSTSAQPSTSSQGDMLKPLKINDEITIIPQPAKSKTKPAVGSNRNPQKKV